LLTILKMALSIAKDSVSLFPAIQATRFWLLPRWVYLPLNTSAFLLTFLVVPELNTHPAYPLSTPHWVPRGISARLRAKWIATPFLWGSFILYFMPVYPGAQTSR